MATLHSLKVDKGLPAILISSVIIEEFDLTEISIGNEIHRHLENGTALSTILKNELASGQLLSISTIETILDEILSANKNKDLLLYSYPRTQQQLHSLKALLQKHDIGMGNTWYFKNANSSESGHLELAGKLLTTFLIDGNEVMTSDTIKELILLNRHK